MWLVHQLWSSTQTSTPPPPSSGCWSLKVQKHAEICAEKSQTMHNYELLNNLLSLKQERVSVLSQTTPDGQNLWLHSSVSFFLFVLVALTLQQLKDLTTSCTRWIAAFKCQFPDANFLLCIVSWNIINQNCQCPVSAKKYTLIYWTPSSYNTCFVWSKTLTSSVDTSCFTLMANFFNFLGSQLAWITNGKKCKGPILFSLSYF